MNDLLWRILAWVVTRQPIRWWLITRALQVPYTHIYKDQAGQQDLYMGRWWLFNPDQEPPPGAPTLRRYAWLPISVRVHHIVRPDGDRHLHDHPWNARTIILDGWYLEQREDGYCRVRLPGDTASLGFGEFHRINAVCPERGATTLFITGRYRGAWGFRVDGEKVPAQLYRTSTGQAR